MNIPRRFTSASSSRFCAQDDGHPIGVVSLTVDPNTYLYPFIERWPTLSETAETLLIRREGNEAVFLNELRFQENTALALRIPLETRDNPAVKVVLGEEGNVEGIDYRGVPVLAAIRACRFPLVSGGPYGYRGSIRADARALWLTILLSAPCCSGRIGHGSRLAGPTRPLRPAESEGRREPSGSQQEPGTSPCNPSAMRSLPPTRQVELAG